MPRLNVNPTRMELTRLKKRLLTARRGHKLLKDKRDELMKQFLDTVRTNKALRRKVELNLIKAQGGFASAAGSMGKVNLEQALLLPKQVAGIDVDYKNIMSVDVPIYTMNTATDAPGDIYPYSFATTASELDDAVLYLNEVLGDMIKLAEVEKSVQLLSLEIEKTRRRVNALEYVMIPRFAETIKYITMKLDENERGNTTRLMKVKDMMVQDQLRKAIEAEKELREASL